MSYNWNWTVNVSATIDAQPYGVSKTTVIQTTSSNAIQQTATLTGSNWSPIAVGQLTNFAGMGFYNDPNVYSSSVIIIASNGANLAYIQPGQAAGIPWSGSLSSLSASATPNNTASLQYTLFQA